MRDEERHEPARAFGLPESDSLRWERRVDSLRLASRPSL